jgi:hypothetical protein
MQTNQGGRLDQGDHLSSSVISLTIERKPHLRRFPPDDNASCRSRCVAPTAAQCRCCSRCLATLSVPISRGELGVLPPLLASSWRTRQGPASSGRVGLDWAMLFSCATTAGLAGMLAGTSTSKAIPELGGLWRSPLSEVMTNADTKNRGLRALEQTRQWTVARRGNEGNAECRAAVNLCASGARASRAGERAAVPSATAGRVGNFTGSSSFPLSI